ncbi:hypothetical protein [Tomitella cavernea]|nr:hypothetical protein [Tomitella cavernea]
MTSTHGPRSCATASRPRGQVGLLRVQDLLNTRPRPTLDYDTPPTGSDS